MPPPLDAGLMAPSSKGDLALFIRRVSELIKRQPVTCGADTSVTEAALLMTRFGVGSVIVMAADGTPVGIVTDHDLRTRVVAEALPVGTPLRSIMSSPVIHVEPGCLAFDALLEMTRRRVHHLAVVADGRLVGVVSSHDIILLQGAQPVALVRDIEGAETLEQLVTAAPRIQAVVRWLVGAGAGVLEIGRIIAELNDRLVGRALALVVSTLEQQGEGKPPLPYAWLVAGSERRGEQTLKTDQDNGLVYQDPSTSQRESVARYFSRLSGAMGEVLLRLGFPLCPGGFMASNPLWCQPDSVWRGYFTSWMDAPEPQQVLRASLFFDLRPIAGDEGLGEALWSWVCDRAPSQRLFLGYMAKAALERRVPLGPFGGFVVERSGAHKGTLDLKARGIFPTTQAVRVCALSLGLRETNTMDRLAGLGARGFYSEAEVKEVRDAHEIISRIRLSHQLARLDAGLPADNSLDPRTLGKVDRMLLKQAFKAVSWLQRDVGDRFRTALVG